MQEVNCREAKMCVFCKHWLGENPKVDYLTGQCKIKPIKGKCAVNETKQYHVADGLCHHFNRSIVYM